MSSHRGANQGRDELKGFYKNKTDGGKVKITKTKPGKSRWSHQNDIGIWILKR